MNLLKYLLKLGNPFRTKFRRQQKPIVEHLHGFATYLFHQFHGDRLGDFLSREGNAVANKNPDTEHQKTSVLHTGRAPSPVPNVSRITPPMPVLDPP